MAKRHRLIRKALNSLNWIWKGEENPLNTMSDLELMVSDAKKLLVDIDIEISELEESKEEINQHLENLSSLKNQIDIEEYKELNPGKNIIKV